MMKFLPPKEKRAVWLRAFHIWQLRPHEVAPLSDINHTCSSCGTHFQGNYCPRCGQAASVGRFSFKKAFLLFIDVWGIGNRGMFRSIRDLMLRPGYMIRDYLKGMQSAYFPPFKMFFLLAALSIVVDQGFSLGLDEAAAEAEKQNTEAAQEQTVEELKKEARQEFNVKGEAVDSAIAMSGLKVVNMMDVLRTKNPAVFSLLTLSLFSLPLFWFFRSTPNIPDMRYPEFLVALVYTSNSYSLYSILGRLLDSDLIRLLAAIMVFVALKQFSGYAKKRVLGYIVLSFLISIIIFICLITAVVAIYYVLKA